MRNLQVSSSSVNVIHVPNSYNPKFKVIKNCNQTSISQVLFTFSNEQTVRLINWARLFKAEFS